MKTDSLKEYVALKGKLSAEKSKLEARLRAIDHALGQTLKAGPGRPPKVAKAAKPAPTRKISAAGRARIAAAQRARWAKIKAAKKPAK
jgi:hypothetical protein